MFVKFEEPESGTPIYVRASHVRSVFADEDGATRVVTDEDSYPVSVSVDQAAQALMQAEFSRTLAEQGPVIRCVAALVCVLAKWRAPEILAGKNAGWKNADALLRLGGYLPAAPESTDNGSGDDDS